MESSSSQRRHQNQHQNQRQLLCVTTNKPSHALAGAGGGGGALTMVCPYTGSVSSSLVVSGDLASTASSSGSATSTSQQQLGMSSLSLFPTMISDAIHPSQTPMGLAYGGKTSAAAANRDCAAMLVSLNATNPKTHWKARLPEPNLTGGIVVTKCGHYAIGGGKSGSLYVWSTISQKGRLLRTLPKAHYRSVTSICCSHDQRHVLTGGADGMVHLFSLLDLVQQQESSQQQSSSKSVTPIRTWSQHAVPITALACLSGDRMISASQDGVLLVLETFSEQILAKIRFPQGIQTLTTTTTSATGQQQVWVGGNMGTIYCLDLDDYSMHQTIQLGAKIASSTTVAASAATTTTSTTDDNNTTNGPTYQTTLKGHQHPVTSLLVWGGTSGGGNHHDGGGGGCGGGGQGLFLASGDSSGTMRVWDLTARVCIRIVQPWASSSSVAAEASASASASGTNNSKKDSKKKAPAKQQQHPISSIHLLNVPEVGGDGGSGGAGKYKSNNATLTSLLPPLQKYSTTLDEENASGMERIRWTTIPLWNSDTTTITPDDDIAITTGFWDVTKTLHLFDESSQQRGGGKRKRQSLESQQQQQKSTKGDDDDDEKDDDDSSSNESEKDKELKRLRQQLEEANSKIARWEKVNNELVAKLKKQKK